MAQSGPTVNVALYVTRQLKAWGVDTLFGVPGDTILPLLEAIRQEGGMHWIACRHEGAAALAASGYAKASGRLAACVADAGPGAVQLLNGVYDARRDRVPLLALTGELPRARMGTGWPQDADLGALYRDATVYDRTVSHPDQVPALLRGALRAAVGRGGPARLGVPLDVWSAPSPLARPFTGAPESPGAPGSRLDVEPAVIEQAARILEEAKRPVIFAGRGALGVSALLQELATELDAALVHSLPAVGMIPFDCPANLGVVGEFGTEAAARAMAQADAVLVVGSTWWQPDYVPSGARIVQVDRRLDHLGMTFDPDIAVWGDADQVVPRIAGRVRRTPRPEWRQFVQAQRQAWAHEIDAIPPGDGTALHPGAVARTLADAVTDDAIVAVDVGNHTFWFARCFRARRQRVLLSGHWRSVGFALPAALGAKLAEPGRQVVAFTGDGGLGMHLAELTTAVAHRLAVACVVLRDGRYGEEESLQREQRLPAFGTRLRDPDFAAAARACGAQGYVARTVGDLEGVLRTALPRLALGEVAVVDVPALAADPVRPQGQQEADGVAPVPAMAGGGLLAD